MAKKTVHAYEMELRKLIKVRTGADAEPWLIPQIEITAMNRALLAKMHEELMDKKSLMLMPTGSMGQTKNDAHPLLAHYDKMQRTLTMQYQALGLNYNISADKIIEAGKKVFDDSDPLKNMYEQAKL